MPWIGIGGNSNVVIRRSATWMSTGCEPSRTASSEFQASIAQQQINHVIIMPIRHMYAEGGHFSVAPFRAATPASGAAAYRLLIFSAV